VQQSRNEHYDMKHLVKCITITFVLACVAFRTSAQNSLSPADFRKQLASGNGILIDVRTATEYDSERIQGAININVNDSSFTDEINKLDKARSYFVYCGIGKRSARAVAIMKKNGFVEVYDLQSGLDEWKLQGMPTIKGIESKKN
jgi:rhodanese-related sulfurtransferase